MGTLVVVVQCHLVMNRCSGYNCMKTFYRREGPFAEYGEDARYMLITCGGCCGAQIAAKLEDLQHHLQRNGEEKDNVVIHLASCICTDNYHRPPCPHLDYIQAIIKRKGFTNVVLGSYISKISTAKREAGIYAPIPEVK